MAEFTTNDARRILTHVNREQSRHDEDPTGIDNPEDWNRLPQLCVTQERVLVATQRFKVRRLGNRVDLEAQHLIQTGTVTLADTFTLTYPGLGTTGNINCIDDAVTLQSELDALFGANNVVGSWIAGRYVVEFLDTALDPVQPLEWNSNVAAIVAPTMWPDAGVDEEEVLVASPMESGGDYLAEGTFGTMLFMPLNGGFLFHSGECWTRDVEGFEPT